MALVFYKFHSLSASKIVFQFLTYRLLKNVLIIHSDLLRLIFDHARICVYVQQFFKTGLFIKIVTYWEVLVSVLVVCPCKICVPAS